MQQLYSVMQTLIVSFLILGHDPGTLTIILSQHCVVESHGFVTRSSWNGKNILMPSTFPETFYTPR